MPGYSCSHLYCRKIWVSTAKGRQYESLAEKTGTDTPVIFCSSFQNPSLFRFFTGGQSTALSSVTTRTTQFDIWRWEEQWTGQPVWMVNREMDRIEKINSFQSANRLKIEYAMTSVPKDWPRISPGDSISLDFTISNPNPYAVDIRHPELPLELKAVFTEHKRMAIGAGPAPYRRLYCRQPLQMHRHRLQEHLHSPFRRCSSGRM